MNSFQFKMDEMSQWYQMNFNFSLSKKWFDDLANMQLYSE